jgi:hypothetical protein
MHLGLAHQMIPQSNAKIWSSTLLDCSMTYACVRATSVQYRQRCSNTIVQQGVATYSLKNKI